MQAPLFQERRNRRLASVLDGGPDDDDMDTDGLLGFLECERDGVQRARLRKEADCQSEEGRCRSSTGLVDRYLRSLGDRPLLTREQEVALAERIGDGTGAVRAALQDAVLVAERLGWKGQIRKPAKQLREIGEANGLARSG